MGENLSLHPIRDNNRLNHLGSDEVAMELVQPVQPEIVTVEVERGLRPWSFANKRGETD